jgi:hypothetical protein
MRDEADGRTVRETARYLRVSRSRIIGWIKAGILGALDVASNRCGRSRYIILPHHLSEFEMRRSAAMPKKAPRQKKQRTLIDFFPD